ncbi:MAG: RuBisCO large subunit C-terminal-like domain-containing protein [Elusimicrobiota bacterium]|jgi:ribulose-bisphosphate carboxylase large chain
MTTAPADPIRASYLVRCSAADAEGAARAIAFEQTVEVPEDFIKDDALRERIVGRVRSVAPQPGARDLHRVEIDYNPLLGGGRLPQLLNLVFGNVSIYPEVRLVDLRLPDAFLARFRGPRYGVEGLRRLLGVHGRPLLATAVKPMGAGLEHFERVVRDFALGGGDIVKDDQNLADETPADFLRRVERCQRAVEEADRSTGRRALYLPHLTGTQEELEERLRALHGLGVRGVLACPAILGLENTRSFAEKHGLVLMAHPAFSGTLYAGREPRVDPGLYLGTLMRLVGADVSIFPNAGGRFAFTPEDCAGVSRRLAEPLGTLKAAFPAPAGGMRFESLAGMAERYGAESVFLVGGALLSHHEDVRRGTEAFLGAMRKLFKERLEAPSAEEAFSSACELPSAKKGAVLDRLAFRPDWSWEGRPASAYKADETLPFQGVSRRELVGAHGEKTAFDLRYFELAPGGHTSLEKHAHTHTVVCVRGRGVLVKGKKRVELGGMDIGYVGPFETHQLRNEGAEPFGFFCIVDRERDRPVAP